MVNGWVLIQLKNGIYEISNTDIAGSIYVHSVLVDSVSEVVYWYGVKEGTETEEPYSVLWWREDRIIYSIG